MKDDSRAFIPHSSSLIPHPQPLIPNPQTANWLNMNSCRRKTLLLASLFLLLTLASTAPAADWPTYQRDASRGGVTTERLATPLSEAWVWRSRHRPRPAWPGPAKVDLYNKVYDLKPRMTFDKAFQVAAAGDKLFFGSSADDQLRALDLATGAERWTFFAEAPIRFAPTVYDGRVLFGSDDGRVYALAAENGKTLWQCNPVEPDYRLPGNGRVISLWAVRTGVVVMDENAYFASGLFPNEGVYVSAIRVADGSPVWRTRIADRPAQGYLLASATRLYVPTGRENPLVFDRHTGSPLRAIEGAGGSYALLASDTLIFGPGKSGELGVVEPEKKEQLATFVGSQVLVDGNRFYLLGQGQLRALDRRQYLELAGKRRTLTARQAQLAEEIQKLGKSAAGGKGLKLAGELAAVQKELAAVIAGMKKSVLWQAPCPESLSLILAGDVLFASGDGVVAAYRADDGKRAWSAKVAGGAYGLAVAGGRLIVSTDEGTIHCFQPAAR